MYFSVLGPLTVLGDDRAPIPVRAPLHRGVLAILLARANHVVSRDELADLLWDGQVPDSAVATINTYVFRLRRALGTDAGARIRSQPPGYLIEVTEHEYDVLELRALRERTRAAQAEGDWTRVSALAAEALGLWRGEPFADVPVPHLHRAELPALAETRAALIEAGAEAGLRLDRAGEAATALAGLVAEQPLRESAYATLMTALGRQGRRGEALDVYRRARKLLRDQLGLDPGEALVAAHRALLAGPAGKPGQPGESAAPAAASPRQLPALPRFFTGRAAELDALTRAHEAFPAGIVTVMGAGGMGKTALALTWAHQAADRFPDGQLYVDLRGFDPGGSPVPPGDAAAGFLHALGVPAGGIPNALADRSAMFRTLVQERRMLVLLDNAADSEQVGHLLPGGDACFTVVTSRDRLAGLVATRGAQPLPLTPLTGAEARNLLALRLGERRVVRDAAVFRDLAERCGGLPLALSVLAARLSLEPDLDVAELAGRLRDDSLRLAELGVEEAAGNLRAVFSWSRRRLGTGAAGMFGRIGLHPGPSMARSAAAVVAGVGDAEAEAAIRELVGAHLVYPDADDRLKMHDLLRLYAFETAIGELDVGAVRDVRLRVLDHYLHAAFAADRAINPMRPAVRLAAPHEGSRAAAFQDARPATEWLDQEREVLLALSDLAAREGFDAHAWQIPWTLTLFLDRRGDWRRMVDQLEQAVEAAERCGDPAVLARAHFDAGTARWRVKESQESQAHFEVARQLWEELGDFVGLGRTARWRAITAEDDDHETALFHAMESVELFRKGGDPAGEAMGLTSVAWQHSNLDHPAEALVWAEQALVLHRQVGNVIGQADVLDTIAISHHRLGRSAQSLEVFEEAVQLYHQLGSRLYEAACLSHAAEVHQSMGDRAGAAEKASRATELADELGLPADHAIRLRVRDATGD